MRVLFVLACVAVLARPALAGVADTLNAYVEADDDELFTIWNNYDAESGNTWRLRIIDPTLNGGSGFATMLPFGLSLASSYSVIFYGVPESDGSCNFTLQLGRSDQSETYHMAAEGNFVDGNQQLVKAYRFQGHFSLLAVDTFNVTGQIHAGTSLCRWDMVRFQDSQDMVFDIKETMYNWDAALAPLAQWALYADTNTNYYGDNTLISTTAGATATYLFRLASTDVAKWEVFVWTNSRALKADGEYAIRTENGFVRTVTISQTAKTGQFISLGNYTLDQNSNLTLTCRANQPGSIRCVADAVRIVQRGPPCFRSCNGNGWNGTTCGVSDGCGGTCDCVSPFSCMTGTCGCTPACGNGRAGSACGAGADGCLGSCGCALPFSCVNGFCSCTPIQAGVACQGLNCGNVSDGCVGVISCWPPGSNDTCSIPGDTCGGGVNLLTQPVLNVCGQICVPLTVGQACANRECGTASRNCDLGANCGTCAAAAGTCGGGGVAGKCGHPPVNNDCDQAIEVAESTLLQSHSFELLGATPWTSKFMECGNVSGDAFYKWRPSKEGRWDFTVQCAAPGLFKMAIYRSSCFGTELSCQNLTCPTATMNVTGFTTDAFYIMRIGYVDAQAGGRKRAITAGTVRAEFVPPFVNLTGLTTAGSSIQSSDSGRSAGFIAGMVILAIVLCVLVVLAVGYVAYRYRQSRSGDWVIGDDERESEQEKLRDVWGHSDSDLQGNNHEESSAEVAAAMEAGQKAEVQLSELGERIERLTAHRMIPGRPDTTGFELEFDYIEMQKPNLELTFKSANLPENKKKNRYENVLSADQTRVKVSPDDEGSNYINANWISGLVTDSEKAYIATQGPLSTTEGDFWRMVWEQSVSVVLMLTREVETNKLKCHKYWPEVGETREYGQLKVKMVNVEDGPEVVRRTLELTYGKDTREVTQFQYIAWPDHGVPSSVEAFLNMANQANERNRTLGPQVVHCSAGLGRTGTYLIFHMIVQKAIQDLERNHASGKSARDLRKDVNINVVQAVLHLRKSRAGMVQAKEQLAFAYQAVKQGLEELQKQSKKQAMRRWGSAVDVYENYYST